MMIPIDRLPRRKISPRFPKALHREVHRLLYGGVPIPVIAAQFNRTEDAIRYHTIQCAAADAPFDMGDGEAWIPMPTVSPKPTGGMKNMAKPRLTEIQKQEIRTKLEEGQSPIALAREYGVTYQTIQYYVQKGAKALSETTPAPRDTSPETPDAIVTGFLTTDIPSAPVPAEPAPVEQATHLAIDPDAVPIADPEATDADPATESLRRLSDQLNQRLHTARRELNRYQILVGRLEEDLQAVHRSLRLVAESREI